MKNRFRYHHLLTLLLAMSLCYTYAQPINAKVDVLSVKQGIDGLEVDNFFLDNDRKIWLSTPNCLNVCSPQSIENIYYGDEATDIHSKETIAMIQDHGDVVDLFYHNEYGFYDQYKKATKIFKKIKLGSDTNVDNVAYVSTILYLDAVYVITQIGTTINIYNVNEGQTDRIIVPKGIKVKDLILYDKGCYILSEEEQVFRYITNGMLEQIVINKPKNMTTFKNVVGKKIRQKRQIFHLDTKDRLWLGLRHYAGVYVMNNNENSLNLSTLLPKEKLYTWISADDTGKLIFSSTDRFRFTTENHLLDDNDKLMNWEYLYKQFSLPRKIISKDFYDEMFVSTYRNLSILNFKSYDFISSHFVNEKVRNEMGAYGELVWGLTRMDSNRLFFISEFPKWGIYNTVNDSISQKSPGKTMNLFNGVYSSKDKKVWTVAYFRSKRKKFQLLEIDPYTNAYKAFPDSTMIRCLTVDNDGRLYCGTIMEEGKYRIVNISKDGQSFVDYRTIPYQPFGMSYDSSTNKIWGIDFLKGPFGMGLDSINSPIELLNLGQNKGINYYGINFGSNDRMYISSSQGLFVWDRAKHQLLDHISVRDGLSANSVCAVVEDYNGNLWIPTFSGLNYYNTETGYIKQYFTNAGLADEEFNRASYVEDVDGNIYFGGANGFVKIDVNKFYAHNMRISLEQMMLKDDDLDTIIYTLPTETIDLQKNQNTSLSLSISNNDWNFNGVSYMQYIAPTDSKWRRATNNNVFDYSFLEEGDFVIKLKAVSVEGAISNTLEVPIHVYRKWYTKTWFKAVLFMLLLGLLTFGILYRIYQAKREKENAALEFEKRISELELGILQAQMNPHFIFNSISAIQANIDNGEKHLVSQYLTDFASLMRLFLESSRRKMFSLKDEIRLLKLYINLEELRFGDKMDFKFIIDPNLDVNYTKIPTMILQPFVENAINHGLFHKIGKGELTITMKDEPDYIHIIIHDNGIGRVKAKELKKKSLKNYTSRALKIIEERLDILSQTNQFSIDIAIEDLYDSAGVAMGTAVNIRVSKDGMF